MAGTKASLTRSQRYARAAAACLTDRSSGRSPKEYRSRAVSFPALIHAAGLCQALAFAASKEEFRDYLDDLARVLESDREALLRTSREADTFAYLRLGRDAMEAAGWLKRYAEALLPAEDSSRSEVTRDDGHA